MRTIHVRLDYVAKCWTASHYVDGSADAGVVALFGTETLPTPWTLQASERDVMASLRRLNPGAIVERV